MAKVHIVPYSQNTVVLFDSKVQVWKSLRWDDTHDTVQAFHSERKGLTFLSELYHEYNEQGSRDTMKLHYY